MKDQIQGISEIDYLSHRVGSSSLGEYDRANPQSTTDHRKTETSYESSWQQGVPFS